MALEHLSIITEEEITEDARIAATQDDLDVTMPVADLVAYFQGKLDFQSEVKNNLDASSDPGEDDDETQGYTSLSLWVNTAVTPHCVFQCINPSAQSADWIALSHEAIISSAETSGSNKVVYMDKPRIYGSPAALTGGVIFNLTDAKRGTEICIFHEENVAPALYVYDPVSEQTNPAYVLSFGRYVIGKINRIKATYVLGGRVEIEITPGSEYLERGAWYTTPVIDNDIFGGVNVTFDAERIYGASNDAADGNIANTLTDAQRGVIQKIYHNDSVEPTFPAGWVKLAGTYATNELNIIYCEWDHSTRVEYWIVQEA